MASALQGLAYSAQSLAYLKTIPLKFRRQIVNKVACLLDDPRPPICRMLKGVKDGNNSAYRIRSGDYRILYSVRSNPDQIVILDIGHRKDVYR